MQWYTANLPWLNTSLSEFNLIPISDTHIGDANHSDKDLAETLYKAEQTNAAILLVGDIINNAIKSSISNCYEETMKPGEQIKYVTHLLEPHKHRIIGAVEGNHERRTTKEVDQSPCERYCERLGIPYFGNEVLLKYRFGKNDKGDPMVYSQYATHGSSGSRTVGGRVNSLSKLSDIITADVICQAHTHQLSVHSEVIFIPDLRTETVKQHIMYFVSTGGYLLRGGYAAVKGYAPLKVGSPFITLSGKIKDVKVTI